MSGVDVLEVMDSGYWRLFGKLHTLIEDSNNGPKHGSLNTKQLRDCMADDADAVAVANEARVALAELIEKNEQLTKAVRAFADGDMSEAMRNQLFRASSDEPAKSTFADLCTANDECEAALSRVRGAE